MHVHAHILQMLPQVAPWGAFRIMQCASKAFRQTPGAMFMARCRHRTLARMINGNHMQFWYRLPNYYMDGRLYNVVGTRITHIKYRKRNTINGVHVRYRQCGNTVHVKYVGKYINGMRIHDTYYYANGVMESHTHRMVRCEYDYTHIDCDDYGRGEFIVRIRRNGVTSMQMMYPQDGKLRLECCDRDVCAASGDVYLKQGVQW